MLAIGTIVFFTVIYSIVNSQLFSSLILFFDRYVDRFVGGVEVPASMVISMSSAIALILAPLLSFLWIRLRRVGKDPNPSVKIAIGLTATGLSYLVPLLAVTILGPTQSMSVAWIFLLAVALVVGEVCLVPTSQSVISTIAPRRIVIMMLGSFGFAIALGASFGGEAAAWLTVIEPGPNGTPPSFEDGMNAYVSAYTYLGLLAIVAGLAVFMIRSPLDSRMHLPREESTS